MLDRLLKTKLNCLANELLNKDYRIENITITLDDNFVYIELYLKVSDNCINDVIRITDMIDSIAYNSKSTYSHIKSAILHIIEREYEKQLVGVLNG